MVERAPLRVAVAYSPAPRKVHEWRLLLGEGATVLTALRESGLAANFPELDLGSVTSGIWGRKARLDHLLHDGDRVEVYRQLTVDPKLARRERFRRQGSRAAGLFAGRRDGSKAGY